MGALYDTTAEEYAHNEAIESLIEETRLPADFVRSVYEREFLRLKATARVRDFLVLFTVRKTREALRSATT
jgi:Protein of unknown function (DUF3562)